jgi:hypothetical protein
MPKKRDTGNQPIQGRRTPGKDPGAKKAKVPNSSRRALPGQSKPEPKVQKYGLETPCIARGNHGKDCICGGTKNIRTVR